jgi:hypothetical protein
VPEVAVEDGLLTALGEDVDAIGPERGEIAGVVHGIVLGMQVVDPGLAAVQQLAGDSHLRIQFRRRQSTVETGGP